MAINPQMPQGNSAAYNPRWFIWAIVFLVVSGISLVSYIVLSDTGANTVPDFTPTKMKTTKTTTAPSTTTKTAPVKK